MDTLDEASALKALLDWQAELGADVAIGEMPADRYAESAASASLQGGAGTAAAAAVAMSSAAATPDPVEEAKSAAAASPTLDALAEALGAFDHCELKRGARRLVFSDGRPGARVMIVGEAPGREEDEQGKPFVGRAGQLLDRMLAAIGLDRNAPDLAQAVYITNILPWRPPQNRAPTPEEIAMLRPFVVRHVELAAPDVVIAMGNTACAGLLGQKGITRLRGSWNEFAGRPCLPMFHPAFLLRNPYAKREAWADLLSLKSRLD
ncbi:MAG: uracil-DNA glycosylase [Rhodobacteraceae bacterium]|nr:uracil-DNA glycosylase [Paracoccaceae bacterium]